MRDPTGMNAREAGALNALLVKLGFPGVTIFLLREHMMTTSLGYTEDAIERKLGKAVRQGERFGG